MKKILILIIFVSQVSCNNKKDRQIMSLNKLVDSSNPIEITIDVDDKNMGRTAEELFEEPTFVKLETTKNNLIGKISQLLFIDNLIVVVDNSISNSICVFGIDGKFINKIGKQGQGPGEYISCAHISKVPNEDMIAVMDDKLSKIHYYKLDGRHVNSIKLDFLATNMEFINSEKIAFVGLNNLKLNNNDLIITNANNDVIAAGFKGLYKENIFDYRNGELMWKFDDKVFFNPNYNDTIFEIGEKSIHAEYRINLVKHGLPKINDKTTNNEMKEYSNKFIRFNGHFVDFDDVAIFYISLPNMPSSFAIYSKQYKKTYIYNLYNNSSFYFMLSSGQVKARYKENILAQVVQAQDLIIGKQVFDEQAQRKKIRKSKVDELFNRLSEEDNPVIFFYKINIK